MTVTEERPAQTTERPPQTARPRKGPDPLRVAVPAAAWALMAGLVTVAVPVLVAWAADSRSGSGAAAALAAVGQVWLAAHGASMGLGAAGEYDLLPLGLTAVPAVLLVRAGRHAALLHHVTSVKVAARLVGGIALSYGTVAAIVSALSKTDGVQPAPVQSLLGALALAVGASGFGVLRAAELPPGLLDRVPERVRLAVRAGAVALAGILLIGGLLAAGSLLSHGGAAANLAGSAVPGLLGGVVLLLVCLAYAPLALVWGACWVVGPGFTVGTDTQFGPFGTTPGPAPSLPLLAALPGGSAPVWLAVLVVLLPVGLGVLAGEVVHRRGGGWVEAALAGPVAGFGLALLAVAASGPVGGDRLALVGPVFWQVGPVFAMSVALGATGLVLARGLLGERVIVLPDTEELTEATQEVAPIDGPTMEVAPVAGVDLDLDDATQEVTPLDDPTTEVQPVRREPVLARVRGLWPY
jgi:hypothetical protein